MGWPSTHAAAHHRYGVAEALSDVEKEADAREQLPIRPAE